MQNPNRYNDFFDKSIVQSFFNLKIVFSLFNTEDFSTEAKKKLV